MAQGVVDLPAELRAELGRLLTVDALPTRQEIQGRCEAVAALVYETDADNAPAAVMIGCAPWMMGQLVQSLRDAGIVQCLAAFSKRESVERTGPVTGAIKKESLFRHVGFVECGLSGEASNAEQISPHTLNPDKISFMQLADNDMLAAVASGEVDLNAVARQILAQRGMGQNGRWIGFEAAHEQLIAPAGASRPVRPTNGSRFSRRNQATRSPRVGRKHPCYRAPYVGHRRIQALPRNGLRHISFDLKTNMAPAPLPAAGSVCQLLPPKRASRLRRGAVSDAWRKE